MRPDAVRGMLKARDPFELIRWLAYSQPDPRKALAELIQNSLDAQAGIVRITRFTEAGKPALKIFDDGLGVIPEMDRRDALQYVATHIGHSPAGASGFLPRTRSAAYSGWSRCSPESITPLPRPAVMLREI